VAGGIADEESADAPRLVGQLVHDFRARGACRAVGRVDVVDLDRGDRNNTRYVFRPGSNVPGGVLTPAAAMDRSASLVCDARKEDR
jgi:hypothetical protein